MPLLLPYSLEYISSNPCLANAPNPIDRLSIAAKFVGIEANSKQEAVKILIKNIRELQRSIGEPLSLKEAGIDEKQMSEKIENLVNLATLDVNMFSSPCECKNEKLKHLFQSIWEAGEV